MKRTRRIDIGAILIFIIAVGIFFYQSLFYGKIPAPVDALVGLYHPWRDLYSDEHPRGVAFKNFLTTDPVRQQIPWRKTAIDELKNGNLPGWNPYTFSGSPLLANIQSASLYPLNLFFFILPFESAWTVLILAQPLLAGIFLYWWLRHHRVRPIASLFGSLAWAFSGFSIAWFTWGTMVHVMLWFPLALLATDKILSVPAKLGRPLWSWITVLTGSLIAQFFAGHAQLSLYFLLALIAYVFWVTQKSFKKGVVEFFKVIRWWLVGLLGFVFATSIVWVPMLELVQQSSRIVDTVAWQKEGYFLPLQHLIQFLAPDFFGNPTTLNYWGTWNYGEFVGYIGILPLIFALYGVFTGTFSMKRPLIIGLFVSLFFALDNPVSRLVYELRVPIISSLQPTRLLAIVDFCLAALAAFGVEAWLTKSQNKRLGTVVGAVGLFYATTLLITLTQQKAVDPAIMQNWQVAMRNLIFPMSVYAVGICLLAVRTIFYQKKLAATICIAAVLALTAFDLFRFGWKFVPFSPREFFFPNTKVISFLQQQLQPFRIMSLDDRVLPSNTAAYYRLESIEGYDPIYASRYEEFLAAVARGNPNIDPPFGFNRIVSAKTVTSPLVSHLNVRYVLSLEDQHDPNLTLVFREGLTRVYEYTQSLPRVYIASRIVSEKDKQKIIDTMHESDFISSQSAIIEESVPLLSLPSDLEETVSVTQYLPQKLIFDTSLKGKRLVVINNSYDPHWQAYIDESRTKVYRVNFAFQGVVVPEGTHRVSLMYK